MGTVLIHSGMPKTGSTSIQTWLRRYSDHLRDEHRISLMRVPESAGAESSGRFEAVDARANVNTISFVMLYHVTRQRPDSGAELTALADDFVAALDRAACERGTVLLSAETFSTFFLDAEAPFLASLDRLAERHEVRVAYYARPQDSALEARWRQWGFRSEMGPSTWVLDQARQLRYADTIDAVARLAPGITFDVRPFRRDLLVGNDVVVDFAEGFLGLADAPGVANNNENPGLSLDFAILLRDAPSALIDDPGARMQTGARQLALGKLGRSWELPESDAAVESRRVLQRYAYEEFEPRNRDLIRACGWPTDAFVRPPDTGAAAAAAAAADLTALDELWTRPESDPAREYLYAALTALIAKRPGARAAGRAAPDPR